MTPEITPEEEQVFRWGMSFGGHFGRIQASIVALILALIGNAIDINAAYLLAWWMGATLWAFVIHVWRVHAPRTKPAPPPPRRYKWKDQA